MIHKTHALPAGLDGPLLEYPSPHLSFALYAYPCRVTPLKRALGPSTDTSINVLVPFWAVVGVFRLRSGDNHRSNLLFLVAANNAGPASEVRHFDEVVAGITQRHKVLNAVWAPIISRNKMVGLKLCCLEPFVAPDAVVVISVKTLAP